jgi:hypothetical protein
MGLRYFGYFETNSASLGPVGGILQFVNLKALGLIIVIVWDIRTPSLQYENKKTIDFGSLKRTVESQIFCHPMGITKTK